MPVDANSVFFLNVETVDFLDLTANRDKARPASGSEAKIKWLGGPPETGPWVYYIEHPANAIVKPHKHLAPRIEYVLDGELEFFLGVDAVAWFRGDTSITGTLHGAGSMSYVPSGTVYAYRITQASKLLHVFYENPVGRTVHVGDETAVEAAMQAIIQTGVTTPSNRSTKPRSTLMGKQEARPLRSVLFIAGSDEDALETAAAQGADAIVIDIEEPRTPFPEHERAKARILVHEFLESASTGPGSPLWFVRVQPLDTGMTLRDLNAILLPALAGVLLPKIQTAGDIIAADVLLKCVETEMGLPIGSTYIYPILETAQALRNAYEIAAASDRVGYMGGAVSRFGDIHQAIGFRWTGEGTESLYLRSKALIDARAAGVRWPISGMWGGDLDDETGLRHWVNELRDLGYRGMLIGDPSQIPIAHEIFSPTAEEISYWQDLDRLATEAEAMDSGPIVYGDPNKGEGHTVHIAHVGSARMNLDWARHLGLVSA
jgi:citrate lyase subunit beta/citryl-CoA lyase